VTDTERINWLESRGEIQLIKDYEEGLWGVYVITGNVNDRVGFWLTKDHETLRKALDAAEEEEWQKNLK
jgi:hypothetical protein